MKRRGMLVALEGLDGAGTTTQCSAIAQALRQAGRKVHETAEPSRGPIGQMIRQALVGRLRLQDGGPLSEETLALLFAADRTDHLANEMEPLLAKGVDVVTDRYVLSSIAYQGSALPLKWVEEINRCARPADLTLWIDVDAETASVRRMKRGGSPDRYETKNVQLQVASVYRKLSVTQKARWGQVVVLDGNARPGEVTQAALKAISAAEKRR